MRRENDAARIPMLRRAQSCNWSECTYFMIVIPVCAGFVAGLVCVVYYGSLETVDHTTDVLQSGLFDCVHDACAESAGHCNWWRNATAAQTLSQLEFCGAVCQCNVSDQRPPCWTFCQRSWADLQDPREIRRNFRGPGVVIALLFLIVIGLVFLCICAFASGIK